MAAAASRAVAAAAVLLLALLLVCRAADAVEAPPSTAREPGPEAATAATVTAHDFKLAFEHLLPALQDLATSAQEMAAGVAPSAAEPGAAPSTSSTRRLLAAATPQQRRTASRVNLLAADAFSMVYTGELVSTSGLG